MLRNFTGAVCKNNPFKTECTYMLQDFLKNDISIAPPDGANAVLNTDRTFRESEPLIYFTASKGKKLFSPKRVK